MCVGAGGCCVHQSETPHWRLAIDGELRTGRANRELTKGSSKRVPRHHVEGVLLSGEVARLAKAEEAVQEAQKQRDGLAKDLEEHREKLGV